LRGLGSNTSHEFFAHRNTEFFNTIRPVAASQFRANRTLSRRSALNYDSSGLRPGQTGNFPADDAVAMLVLGKLMTHLF
jgi:hypothetical protein